MTINMKLLGIQIGALFVMLALPLFLSAGTVAWPGAWAFLILFIGFTVAISLWLSRHNPDLLKERMKGNVQAEQRTWDKLFVAVESVILIGWLILMGLDAVRFGWSHMPGWLQIVGALILISSFYGFFLTFRENSFLSPVIRVQEERGQTVISTGPYHYVRHPMYASLIPWVLGTTLLLGSWYGLIPALALVVGAAQRAVVEERTLRQELPGYDEYMTQVKYRLIPGVW